MFPSGCPAARRKTMHTNGASDASVHPFDCLSLSLPRTMYTLEHHHGCIHSVVVIVVPPTTLLSNYASVSRLSCWLVAHKTHSSKSTNGFRYEMHETDRQTYCAAFLPHRVSSIAGSPLPSHLTTPLSHLHTRC